MRALHLTTYRRSFFEQQIAGLRSAGVECTVLDVPGDYSPDDPRTVADYLKYYPEVLERGLDSYDIVHANHGLTAPFAFAQPTRPVVVTFWGSELMSERTWLTRLSAGSARLAQRAILPSPAMAPHLDTGFTHVPFPVDTGLFEPVARDRARDYLGWDADATVVLFPYDTSRPEKNYDRARRVVERADVDAELRPVNGHPYEEMPYYMNASDAVLVTSDRESGPLVVREAAACNVPVISTDVGFVRETLTDVDGCAVCPSDAALIDALERILPTTRRSNGRNAIDELGPERIGERLATLYETAIDETEGRV